MRYTLYVHKYGVTCPYVKVVLLFLFLHFSSICSAQQIIWADTVKVKAQIDLLASKKSVAEQDLIFKNAIYICSNASLKLWKVRLLNFWSQQKIAFFENDTAHILVKQAIALAGSDEEIRQSVDYRDALVQIVLTSFNQNKFDSSIYWCTLGKKEAHLSEDFFNESVFTTMEAINYILLKRSPILIDSLFRGAIDLAQRSESRHDDAMALHNYAYFQKSFPSKNLKASLETLMKIQDFSTDQALQKNQAIPYRRATFFYRGTHIMLLHELAYGYIYLSDFEQALSYIQQITRKNITDKAPPSITLSLFEEAFVETYLGHTQKVQLLYDSAIRIKNTYAAKEDLPFTYYWYVKGWLAEQQANWAGAVNNYKRATTIAGNTIDENIIALFRTHVKSKNVVAADELYNRINQKIDSNAIQFFRVFFYKELPAYYRLKQSEVKALQATIDYFHLKDSMTGIANYLVTSRLEKQFKTKEKDRLLVLAEKEKSINQKQLSLKNKQLLILIGSLVLLTLAIFLFIRNSTLKKRQVLVLEEKNNQIETLIRELHHRVKNNLQVVSGLLSLQSSRMEDDKARQAMDEGRTRVDAMAMIHQKLYMDKDLAGVDIKDYLENLTSSLAGSFGFGKKNIETHVTIQQTALDIDRAIPIGLIVNELVTNAFKHAFKNTPHPMISVQLSGNATGSMELKVADNGVGTAINTDTSKSFGMKLVHTLVAQLNGTLQQQNNNGTIYNIQISA